MSYVYLQWWVKSTINKNEYSIKTKYHLLTVNAIYYFGLIFKLKRIKLSSRFRSAVRFSMLIVISMLMTKSRRSGRFLIIRLDVLLDNWISHKWLIKLEFLFGFTHHFQFCFNCLNCCFSTINENNWKIEGSFHLSHTCWV